MSTDLLLFLGGLLGALVNRLAGANPSRSWATLAEVASAGGAMVVLNASGLVPEELRTAMYANPFRTGIFAFLVGLLMGPGLVTLTKSLVYRIVPPKVGNGTGGRVVVGLAIGLAVALTLGIWLPVMATR